MRRNIWPYAIIAYFAVFITGMVTWVAFAMRHDDQLVRPDYYDHELKYQKQIDRVTRTGALATGARVSYDHATQQIRLELPREHHATIEGAVHFYRPSDARLDQKVPLQINGEGAQQIDVSNLRSGLWKVFVSWKALDQDYYLEQAVVLYAR